MSINIVALRRMIWKPLGQDSDNDPELPRDEIDLYLNRAYWEIQDKFPFREKEKLATFPTIAGVRGYDVPQPFEAIQHIAIVDPKENTHAPLEQITADTYERHYDSDDHARGFPTHYLREGCMIKLWPTPNVEYTIVMRRLVTLADLSNNNAVPKLPQVWHEIIGYGGLWRAYWDIGDQQRAANTKRLQESLLNTIVPTKAKEERANTELAHLEVIRNPYGW